MAYALKDIRSAVARQCDDWVEVRATETSGSPNVLVDNFTLGYENDHHFRGSELWMATGLNAGLKARVIDSNLAATSLTLGGGLLSAPVMGDTGQLFNIGGIGNRIGTYDAQIRDAIQSLGREAYPFYTDTLDAVWDDGVYWADIPVPFRGVFAVYYNDVDGNQIEVPSYGWVIDPVTRRIALAPEFASLANGYDVTVHGKAAPTVLTLDAHTTEVDFEWLVHEVAGNLLLRQQDQLKVNRGGMLKNQAESLRGKAAPHALMTNMIWLDE